MKNFQPKACGLGAGERPIPIDVDYSPNIKRISTENRNDSVGVASIFEFSFFLIFGLVRSKRSNTTWVFPVDTNDKMGSKRYVLSTFDGK